MAGENSYLNATLVKPPSSPSSAALFALNDFIFVSHILAFEAADHPSSTHVNSLLKPSQASHLHSSPLATY